ncbi:MAG TPA: dATP/dGTP diphosphohydrolase domain-containing protein [Desulfosporosinus sp.]|nr:dATP/dGTP diphosphohydrolase domain-containing protein [Desulfosporosinus sp.]
MIIKECATCSLYGKPPDKYCNDCGNYTKWIPRHPKQLIKDSGERTNFSSGSVRDMHQGKGRYDLLPWEAIHELALHCEEGAMKYGERNCEKGIPIHSLIDSAMRHISCYSRGMKDEPHLRAAMWNIAFAIWTEIKHPEMQDIPERLTK